MNLDINFLTNGSNITETISIKNDILVTSINHIVNAQTGEPTSLLSLNTNATSSNIECIARQLHEHYAGDCAFIIRKKNDFAVLRPAFSEFSIFYKKKRDTIKFWTGSLPPQEILQTTTKLNQSYLAAWLHNQSTLSSQTGLLDIFEIVSGSTLFFTNNEFHLVDYLTELLATTNLKNKSSFEEDSQSIGTLISNSIAHKTMGLNGKYSLECSGGIDSSVVAVAACDLHRGSPQSLLHGYSPNSFDTSEIYFFETVANHIRGSKILVDTGSSSLLPTLSTELLAPSLRPCKMFSTIETTSRLFLAAQRAGSKVVLSGDGGDQLFLRLRRRALTRELTFECNTLFEKIRMLSHLASHDRLSIWDVVHELIHGDTSKSMRRRLFDSHKPSSNILSCRSNHEMIDPIPNIHLIKHLPISAAFQFIGIRNAELNYANIKNCLTNERKVFLFWPLIRAAISAQRKNHIQNGMDRALERHAFKELLPDAVFYRAGKGGGLDILNRFDYQSIGTSLFDSTLCKIGLISPDKLQSALRQPIEHEAALSIASAKALSDWIDTIEGAAIESH
ncbi:MAG: asparagine synthase-related protein [Burkholderia cenocepacia]